MTIAIITFDVKEPVTLADAKEMFEGSAPKFRNLPGLVRKYYIVSHDGKTVGGVYHWESLEIAKNTYSDEWRKRVVASYGAEPNLRYFDAPVIIDNQAASA